MKRMCVWVAFFAGFAATAAAIPFHGMFKETITSSSSPEYSVGESFRGQYWYDSPSVDGTFDVFDGVGPLQGIVFLPFVVRPGDPVDTWMSLSMLRTARLVVVGGHVTSFMWWYDLNGYFSDSSYTGTSGEFSTDSYYDHPIWDPVTDTFEPTPEVTGSLAFGTPVVPDRTSTLGLVGCAIVGLLFVARRRTARLPA